MNDEIAARVERAIAERVFPGCVVGIVQTNGERTILPFGRLTYDADSPAVVDETIYDVASITKSIPTASLALMLIAQEKLSLADAVISHIPELRNDFGATIEDLLRYRITGPQMSKLAHLSAPEIEAHIFAAGFDGPPGASVYTNLPAFLLGIVIERITEENLTALAQKYFFDLLSMPGTSFVVRRTDLHIAPTEIGEDGVEIRGTPHDESARVFTHAGRPVGHAGLFSSGPDLLNFLEALLQDRFPHIVEGAEGGLGWQVNDPQFMGKNSGPKTFGKTGFTGTSIVADREKGISFVILSNRTYPKRPATNDAINALRRAIADIILTH